MMRKILLSVGFLFISFLAYASIFDLQNSSFTQSADTNVTITAKPAVLYSICIDSSASTGGSLSVFNATSTVGSNINFATATIIDTSRTQTGCYLYNTYLSSGIGYTNAGSPAAKVNIQWNLFSH